MPLSAAAAQPALRWGKQGAGGASNEPNFLDAYATITMAAADYTFDEDTTADIKKLAQPYSEVHKAEPAVYREAVQLVALDVVNQLGPSPATVISSIMPRLQQMFMELFPREHVRGELTKLIGKGGSLNTAIAEYRRGGKKARQLKVTMATARLRSPMKKMIAASKVIRSSPRIAAREHEGAGTSAGAGGGRSQNEVRSQNEGAGTSGGAGGGGSGGRSGSKKASKKGAGGGVSQNEKASKKVREPARKMPARKKLLEPTEEDYEVDEDFVDGFSFMSSLARRSGAPKPAAAPEAASSSDAVPDPAVPDPPVSEAYADADGDQDEPVKKKPKGISSEPSKAVIPPLADAPFFEAVRLLDSPWKKDMVKVGQAVAAYYPPHPSTGYEPSGAHRDTF